MGSMEASQRNHAQAEAKIGHDVLKPGEGAAFAMGLADLHRAAEANEALLEAEMLEFALSQVSKSRPFGALRAGSGAPLRIRLAHRAYSIRNAFMGSMDAARCAGSHVASVAIAQRNPAAAR